MSTTTRAALSKKNRYWIERERYMELKHFCMQYPMWKKAFSALEHLQAKPEDLAKLAGESGQGFSDRFEYTKEYYIDRIKMVEDAARRAETSISPYILKAVTEGLSYECVNAKEDIPCCKDVYYNAYRRFFWLLDKVRH